MRTLTKEEVVKYQLGRDENFCLLNKDTDTVQVTSDTIDFCTDTLRRMTPEHPRYKFLELVKKPD